MPQIVEKKKINEALKSCIDIFLDIPNKKINVIYSYADLKNRDSVKKLIKNVYPNYNIIDIKQQQIFQPEKLKKLFSTTSLKNNCQVFELLGLKKKIILEYTLVNLNRVNKTLFGYALKGRDGKSGVLKEISGKAIGRNVIILDFNEQEKLLEFLGYWKVEYKIKEVFENNE